MVGPVTLRLTAAEVLARTATTYPGDDPLHGLRHTTDIGDLDAIAEYWQLANDPANDFEPWERVETIEVARLLAMAICERMHDDLACAVEAAANRRQWRAQQEATCPHCGEDLDDFTGTCPTCELTRDHHGLTLDQAQRVGVAVRFGMPEAMAVRLECAGELRL